MNFPSRKTELFIGLAAILALTAYLALYRPAPGKLSSLHARVTQLKFTSITECNKCHGDRPMSEYCLRCHVEIRDQLSDKRGLHNAMLAGKPVECAHCHSEHNGPDFRMINSVSWEGKDPAAFKHEHVKFLLNGKHSTLSCAACHAGPAAKKFRMAKFPKRSVAGTYLGLSQNCASCHANVHGAGLEESCDKCHDQNSFKTPSFDHEKYFSLKGSHAGVPCASCHKTFKGEILETIAAARPARVKARTCSDCHRSPHRTAWTRDCGACHTGPTAPWAAASARMTPALHAATGFSLAPPHGRVACVKCHSPGPDYRRRHSAPGPSGNPRANADCESCHKDPHGGQFTARYPRCLQCHLPDSFKPARFGVKEHKKFPLTGRHAAAACEACHQKDMETGIVQFAGLSHACASCHTDPHAGQFLIKGETRCERCHLDTNSWKKLTFDHNKQSRYKLDKTHQKVACEKCHPKVRLPDNRIVTQYKPLKTGCGDCHAFRAE